MRLRPSHITIPNENPFGFDLLDRKAIAESLTELAKSSTDGLVLSLHAPWGSGKSTFLAMWRQHLANNGFKTLHFNAWESDFTDDALVALIGELEAGVAELRDMGTPDNPSAVAASINKVKQVGATILRRSLPVALKLATAGALDLDELSEEALGDFAEKIAESQIKAYEESRKSIVKFRDAIGEVAKLVTTASTGGERLPLILIVDELDRCRPPYAVRILECIKHLFAVPGVVFVLAVDKTQLAHSVRSQYGVGMDADGYLRRFFDLELSLPDPSGQKFTNALFDRFGLTAAFGERGGHPETRSDKANLEEIFPQLFKIFSCSLRERERAFALLAFALRSTPKNRLLHPLLLSALIVIKIKDAELYAGISARHLGPDAVLERVRQAPGGMEFIASRLGEIFEALIRVTFTSEQNLGRLVQQYNIQAQSATDEPAKKRAAAIVELLQFPDLRKATDSLEYLLKKLDLVANE